MAKPQVTHVKKRDGRLVPFEPAKLARSLLSAASACSVQQSFFARELADAIAIHLAQSPEGSTPTTDAIAAAAEKVLDDLNFQKVGDAYRMYRLQREESRTRCTVVKPTQPSLFAAEQSITVSFNQDQRTAPWDRARIIRALEREARIPRTAAEEIARAVEEKILSSELRHVTTTLIRALAENELLVRGYSNVLRQRSSVTIPFADIDTILADEHGSGTAAATLGRQALKPYVLARVYSDDVATAHRRGMFYLHGLDHPLYVHTRFLSADLPGSAFRSQCASMMRLLSSGEVGMATWFFDGQPHADRLAELTDWCSDLEGSGRARLAMSANVAGAVMSSLGSDEPAPPLSLLLYGAPTDPAACARHMAALAYAGWPVTWLPAAPWHELSQHITLNLPQAIYRARQNDLDAAIEEVYRTVEYAASAHRQYIQFRTEHGMPPPKGSAGAVSVVGLNESVSVLTGAGIFDGADSMACVRVLMNVLHTTLQRASQAHDRNLVLVMGEQDCAGARLAAIDHSLFPELFGFLPFQPDASSRSIPPYSAVALELDHADNIEPVADVAALLGKYFDCGPLPIHATAAAVDALPHLLSMLIDRSCGCRVGGRTQEGHAPFGASHTRSESE